MVFQVAIKTFFISSLINLSNLAFGQQALYFGNGSVDFLSEAPIELIEASSDHLEGVIDFSESTFAFTFPVETFEGFNSPLQKEHFKEHYLETAKYPNATFSGKMLGYNSCGEESCEQLIKAKGKLVIHGVTRIVTFPVMLSYDYVADIYYSKTDFEVSLEDFDIHVPLILAAKIAPIIKVQVEVNFSLRNE